MGKCAKYNIQVYYYGFQIIIGAINKGILLILLGLLFEILPQLILVTISFAVLRIWIGGLHFNSYSKCSFASLISFLIIGLLDKYIYFNEIINIIIFIFALIIIIFYAPVEHKNRLLKSKDKIKFKLIALFILIVLFIIHILINNVIISNSIVYGVLLSGIIAIPIISKIE